MPNYSSAHITLLFLALIFSHISFADRQLKTITPQSRSSEELLPILQVFIKPPSSIQVYRQHLIIKATPTEMMQINQILMQLDQAAANLIIQIKIEGGTQTLQQNSQISFKNTTPSNNKKIRLPSTTTTLSVNSSQTIGQQSSEQGIRTTEGEEALLQAGNSRFYARARIFEQQVNINLQHISGTELQLSTQVTGNLSHWIYVGELHKSANNSQRHLLSQQQTTQSPSASIYLRIELLP